MMEIRIFTYNAASERFKIQMAGAGQHLLVKATHGSMPPRTQYSSAGEKSDRDTMRLPLWCINDGWLVTWLRRGGVRCVRFLSRNVKRVARNYAAHRFCRAAEARERLCDEFAPRKNSLVRFAAPCSTRAILTPTCHYAVGVDTWLCNTVLREPLVIGSSCGASQAAPCHRHIPRVPRPHSSKVPTGAPPKPTCQI